MDESETIASDGDAFVSLESDLPEARDEIEQSENSPSIKRARLSHDPMGAPEANNCTIPIESDGVASVSVDAEDLSFANEDLDPRNAVGNRGDHPDTAHRASGKSTSYDPPGSPQAMAFADRTDEKDVAGNRTCALPPELKPEYDGSPFREVGCPRKSKSKGSRAREEALSEVAALPLAPDSLYITDPENPSTNHARAIISCGNRGFRSAKYRTAARSPLLRNATYRT